MKKSNETPLLARKLYGTLLSVQLNPISAMIAFALFNPLARIKEHCLR